MLNNVTLQGRLAAEPELRKTQSGVSVVSFALAVQRDLDREKSDFIDCVAWRKTAEFVSQHFRKGQLAIVNGRLETRNWEDKDSNKRKSVEVIAERIYFCGSREVKEAEAPPAEFVAIDENNGDLPF